MGLKKWIARIGFNYMKEHIVDEIEESRDKMLEWINKNRDQLMVKIDDKIIPFVKDMDIPLFEGKNEQEIRDSLRKLILGFAEAFLDFAIALLPRILDKLIGKVLKRI